MTTGVASFGTGYMAGAAFVQDLRGRGPLAASVVASVGRGEDGDVEILEHRDCDEAVERCGARG